MNSPIVLVHVSDIHFTRWRIDGSSYDVDGDVRNELEKDAEGLCGSMGQVTGVVVTGDIAYAADRREYTAALEWLAVLCSKVGCPKEAVWTAPGNHDINRRITDEHIVSLVQADLRKDPSSLDRLLTDATAAQVLFEPLKEYNEFAAAFQCDLSPGHLAWRKDLPLNDGSTLRLCGLNSTLTSSRLDDPNRRLLVVGDASHLLGREDGVAYLSLCHHPTEWLMDGNSFEDLLANRVHIQLFGHKHAQRVRRIGSMLRIVAGATHPDRTEIGWEPRYNVLSIEVVGEAGTRKLRVAVFARKWKQDEMRFVPDFSDDGQPSSVWEIALDPWDQPSEESPSSDGVQVSSFSSGDSYMDAPRRLTYRFLTLPHHRRIEVAQLLKLIADDDGGLTDRALFTRFLARASERGLLGALWREVEDRHTDPAPEPNPFKGQ